MQGSIIYRFTTSILYAHGLDHLPPFIASVQPLLHASSTATPPVTASWHALLHAKKLFPASALLHPVEQAAACWAAG